MSSALHHNALPGNSSTTSPSPGTARTQLALWLSRGLSTAAIVGALGGLAVWGHFSEWQLPKFSALLGTTDSPTADWCQAHNVAEADCIECQPELLPVGKDYGWCKEHGVAQCPFEHPDVAQLKTMPPITPAMFERASRALALRARPENNSHCLLHQKRIQFASHEAVEKAGIDISVVIERPVIEAAVANGEVMYDQNRMAHLSSRVAGAVWQVEKQIGDRVHKGELLALVDAADVGKAKSELLQSIAQLRLKRVNFDRLKPLASSVVSSRQISEAEAALDDAKIRVQSAQQSLVNLGLAIRADDFLELDMTEIARRIQFLGVPEEAAEKLDVASTTSNLFPIRAPLDGIVIDRHVVVGEVVDASTTLFAVADISRMWLMLNLREEDAKYVSAGQTVLFRPSSKDEAEIKGVVGWISTAADEQTRTIKVRVELPNSDGHLRANTFGSARIVLREEPQSIAVPTAALHSDGTCHVVFVRDKNYHSLESKKFFHVRSVRPGVQEGDMTEIIAGLLPGEVVASKNSVVLEAQLLKSNLGSGCGCADGH
jgi:cobalt-zinc-cadmium efflux system membrane fusion protein